ncbi:MAG: IclR family transcriptional regulator [Chloroflexota bacterium]
MSAKRTDEFASLEGGLVRSVLRAVDLLELLSSAQEPIGIVQLARSLGLPPSTTHRLCRSLVRAGFITQDPTTGRYTVGPALLRLTVDWGPDRLLGPQAEETVRRLRGEVGETAFVAVPKYDSALVAAAAEAEDWLRVTLSPRQLLPLHATAAGKVLLAFWPPNRLATWLSRVTLRAYTKRTVTTPDSLRRQLEEVRARGFATEDEEFSPGVRALAVPVPLGDHHVVAALGVAGPARRLRFPDAEGVLGALRRAAAGLSAALKADSAVEASVGGVIAQ